MKTDGKEKPKESNSPGCSVKLIFIVACLACCLIPLVGMLWAFTDSTTENRELAEKPSLYEDGVFNTDILADWGTYFEDHFAYRNVLVTWNAKLRADLLNVSAAESVVTGTDGWLYYYGTLGDYCSWSVISEREADNIAFNLSLMQGYAEANGASFVVTFAPNKNSLYPENMPYYYTQGTVRSLDVLEPFLEEYGINYCNLYAAFSEEEEVLYYEKDTHWNTKGALFACEEILDFLGEMNAASLIEDLEPLMVTDYIGDLNKMLYPVNPEPEEDFSYDDELSWEFTEGESTEDSEIYTKGAGDGSLLMYRDSFANNMIPFLATSYSTAYFTKMVPYDLTKIQETEADIVIIERAERNLSDLGENPAIMPAPSVSLSSVKTLEESGNAQITLTQDGSYLVVTGDLPEEYRNTDTAIYIGVESTDGNIVWYVPFHISTNESDYGYKAYLSESSIENAQKIYLACSAGNEIVCIGETQITD